MRHGAWPCVLKASYQISTSGSEPGLLSEDYDELVAEARYCGDAPYWTTITGPGEAFMSDAGGSHNGQMLC